MKKRLIASSFLVVMLCAVLVGCSNSEAPWQSRYDNPKKVDHVGEVPSEFAQIVENNVFRGVIAFSDRLLTSETVSADKESGTIVYRVRMMDLYGNDLAAYTCSTNDTYHVTTLTATKDGGFLFVLGFRDRHSLKDGRWASEGGFASRVIKCDSSGNLQFDTPFDKMEGRALTYCF